MDKQIFELDGIEYFTEHFCAECGERYTTDPTDSGESGSAWGREDLCFSCAWSRAIENGCEHDEACTCACD